MIEEQLLEINRRIDGRSFIEERTLLHKKINNLHMFFTSDKSILFFIKITVRLSSSKKNSVTSNTNFRQISKEKLGGKHVLIELQDVYFDDVKDDFNEHYHNAILKVCAIENLPLKNAAKLKSFSGGKKIILRDATEKLDWKMAVHENLGNFTKIEKIGDGESFVDIFSD